MPDWLVEKAYRGLTGSSRYKHTVQEALEIGIGLLRSDLPEALALRERMRTAMVRVYWGSAHDPPFRGWPEHWAEAALNAALAVLAGDYD